MPGDKTYGLEIADQPVLAIDVVRYQGEPVALVAADHPEIARQAAKKIVVHYDVLEPVTDARTALGHATRHLHGDLAGDVTELSREAAPLHPQGNLVRHLKIRVGDIETGADDADVVTVVGDYEVGMQDQAFLGPESGLAVPDGRRRRRPLRRDPVAARRPAPDLRGPRPAARTRSGCRWPASAARSAVARTCRCTCTAACSRCTPASR